LGQSSRTCAAEIDRARRKPPESLQAYDLMLRALPYLHGLGRHDLAQATRMLQKAIEIDPAYAPALAHLAWCHWLTVVQGWIKRDDQSVTEMVHLARTALARDNSDPEVLRLAGSVIARAAGDLTEGVGLLERAIILNPNDATALVQASTLHAYAGDTRTAVAYLERANRLNPLNQPPMFYFSYAMAQFVAGEHEAVVEWTAKALHQLPNRLASLRYRAASLGLLGRLEEGRHVVKRLLALVPDFTIAGAHRHIEFNMNNVFKTSGVADSFYEGLRRCGVPE
jgi:adenylate cyclase